ncbi:MAG: hypothetical protein HZB39_12490 [Planctomycetes bacterium]|nr:hypothetical protein [Planctomycetota bacterium]
MTTRNSTSSDPGRAVVVFAIAGLASSVLFWMARNTGEDPRLPDVAATFAQEPVFPAAVIVQATVDQRETSGASARVRAAPAVPIDDAADRDPPRLPTTPVTEDDHYREFRALAAADLGALEALIPAVLDGDAPDCRRVALLRVLFDSRSTVTADTFTRTIRNLPESSSGSRGDSVPGFAVTFLAKRAAREPGALAILERVAFDGGAPMPEGLRRRAAAAFAVAADGSALDRLPTLVAREVDDALILGVTAALTQNPHVTAVDRALSRMGLPLPDRSVVPSPER